MKKALLIVFGLFLTSCVFSQNKIDFSWIAGQWHIQTPKGQVMESWEKVNDSLYTGRSIFVQNGTDTIPQEIIRMIKDGNDWYYIPIVSGQNEGLDVRFKMIFYQGQEFICENKMHDFPQRIAYRRINDSLYASIEGIRKDKFRKQNFDFIKLP